MKAIIDGIEYDGSIDEFIKLARATKEKIATPKQTQVLAMPRVVLKKPTPALSRKKSKAPYRNVRWTVPEIVRIVKASGTMTKGELGRMVGRSSGAMHQQLGAFRKEYREWCVRNNVDLETANNISSLPTAVIELIGSMLITPTQDTTPTPTRVPVVTAATTREANDTVNKKKQRSGNRWTDEEHAMLANLFVQNVSLQQIAKSLNRDQAVVRSKIRMLEWVRGQAQKEFDEQLAKAREAALTQVPVHAPQE
jgi:hypothetical protein